MKDIVLNNMLGHTPIIWNNIEVRNPFINYCREDKSIYPKASSAGYIDEDEDFLIGSSGGFLMNINFIFVDVWKFTQVAEHFRKYKVYTFAKPGTQESKDFWNRERLRRINGVKAKCKLYFKDVAEYYNPNTTKKRKEELLNYVRITGDHYHFLNYSRIKRYPTITEKENLPNNRRNRKITDFPLFVDGQYWDFKLDEFCVLNGYNICESKARRKGFTYSKAARCANIVNLYKDTIIINVAYSEDFVTREGAINSFVKSNLQWLELHTEWKRGFLKEQLDEIKLGYKKSKQGNASFGQNSTVLGGTLRGNTSAAVGKDAVEINFEESGKNPLLQEALGVTLSAIEDGGEKVGIVRVFGTGGTKDTNWIDFSNIFYNPASVEMIPMENIWDTDARNSTCGFFYPQIWAYFPYVDDGNSLLLDAYTHDLVRKVDAQKNQTPSKYIIFVGQRANSPQEAFINTLDNLFSSPALSDHLKYIQYSEELKFYRDGWLDYYDNKLQFLSNDELRARGQRERNYINEVPFNPKNDITGAVRMYYPPLTGVDGKIPKDTYIVLYDPYGKDKNVKDVIIKNSLACIYVIGLRNSDIPYHQDKIVASYVGRMNEMEESDLLAIRFADMYGAKIVAEMDRGTMLQTAKKFGRKDVLAKDVSSYMDDKATLAKESYGIIIGTGDNKLDLLGQMRDWLYQVISINDEGNPTYLFNLITDVGFIKELSIFNMNNNFDRISCYLAGIKHMKYHAIKNFKRTQTSQSTTRTRTNPRRLGALLLGRR